MKKLKQSFTEVIAGKPRKEHYIHVALVVAAVAVAAGTILTLLFTVFNVK